MKVSLYYSSLSYGGVERLLLNIARGLSEGDLEIKILLANAKGELMTQVPPGCEVVDLNVKYGRGGVLLAFSLPKLIQYLTITPPDVLVAVPGWGTIVALLARHITKSPTRVIVVVDVALSILKHSQKLHERLMPHLARWLYPQADAIVVSYHKAADDLFHLTGISQKKIKVIYNPIVTPEIFQKANEDVEHPWFTSDKLPVIIGVGRLVPEKDFSTLIQAFFLVRQVKPVRLIILGEGTERSHLEALIQELNLEKDVELLGYKNNPFAYISRASVFVLSSKREGFPSVLGEAMALGVPVISTNVLSGGPAELLQDGKYGQLVEVGDVKGLANAILKTLKCPPSAKLLQERAQVFSLALASDGYLELIQGNQLNSNINTQK